jgi:hypothetical protein
MLQQEKVRLMTRLAILEKQYGRQIKKAENSFRIDLLTNPVWKKAFFAAVLFWVVLAGAAFLCMDSVLAAVADDQLENLVRMVLIAFGMVLLLTVVVSCILSASRYRRLRRVQEEYHRLLERIHKMNRKEQEFRGRGRGGSPYEDEDRTRRGGSPDYAGMQVLEFEDDDFIYYVEATPKTGGRRSR